MRASPCLPGRLAPERSPEGQGQRAEACPAGGSFPRAWLSVAAKSEQPRGRLHPDLTFIYPPDKQMWDTCCDQGPVPSSGGGGGAEQGMTWAGGRAPLSLSPLCKGGSSGRLVGGCVKGDDPQGVCLQPPRTSSWAAAGGCAPAKQGRGQEGGSHGAQEARALSGAELPCLLHATCDGGRLPPNGDGEPGGRGCGLCP